MITKRTLNKVKEDYFLINKEIVFVLIFFIVILFFAGMFFYFGYDYKQKSYEEQSDFSEYLTDINEDNCYGGTISGSDDTGYTMIPYKYNCDNNSEHEKQ